MTELPTRAFRKVYAEIFKHEIRRGHRRPETPAALVEAD
jgi:hypothetical protein